MTQIVSSQLSVNKRIQSSDEGVLTTASNFGVTPASSTFTEFGFDSEWTYSDDVADEEIRRIGSKLRDSHPVISKAGMLEINTSVVDSMTTIIDWLINPTTSKTFYFSHTIAGTERHRVLKGCVPTRVRISISNRGLIRLDASIFVANPQAEADAHGLTTPTLDSTGLTGTPWKHSSGGLNSFTFNSVTYKERGMDIEVSHDYTSLDSSDSDTVLWMTPAIKKVSGSVNVFKKDILLSADAFALTDRSSSRVLKTSVKTLTLTDMNFSGHTTQVRRGSSDATIESLSFVADDIS